MSDEESPFTPSPAPRRITAQDVDNMLAMMSLLREHGPEIAQHRREMFTLYVGVGFSEAQALELCRTMP